MVKFPLVTTTPPQGSQLLPSMFIKINIFYSYYTIEELWKTVADNAPAWSKFWPRKLFKLAA